MQKHLLKGVWGLRDSFGLLYELLLTERVICKWWFLENVISEKSTKEWTYMEKRELSKEPRSSKADYVQISVCLQSWLKNIDKILHFEKMSHEI